MLLDVQITLILILLCSYKLFGNVLLLFFFVLLLMFYVVSHFLCCFCTQFYSIIYPIRCVNFISAFFSYCTDP